MKLLRALLFLILVGQVIPDARGQDGAKGLKTEHAMVVCVSPDAADVGAAILKQGGSAVDAAVAVAFAMAVTHPQAGNIGGGGFMLVHPGAGKEPTCFDYREKAPLSVNANTLADEKNMLNHRAVGVPGTVRGMELAHKKFGKLPWKEVVLPAVKLASEGFKLPESEARSMNNYVGKSKGNANFQKYFGKPDGTKWKGGDLFVQKDLGRTLKLIADNGPDAFYTGELADLFVAEMKRGNGLVTLEDLKKYESKERKPLQGTYKGYGIVGMPPPSSGGVCVIDILNMLERDDLRKMGRWSVEANHLIVEAMRRAFRERAAHLADPDFTRVPVEHLIDKQFAALQRTTFEDKATKSEKLLGDIKLTESPESKETTHFSVVDKDGMAVSNTYTLEESWGSRVVVDGAGVLLNNEMGDFNTKPGVTNRTGRIGTLPNQMAPGKRMLSSMTPTIIVKEGKPYLVTGSPGGRTIINTTLNVVLNVIEFDMDLQAAVDAPRFHHQWFPDQISFETTKDPQVIELWKGLREKGHKVDVRGNQGDAHSILIDPKTGWKQAGVDRRIEGKAAGY